MSKLNSYQLSRAFFDFSFENPEKIKPNHVAVYFFAIEHCNRLGWKEKFGFPSNMVMEALGIKNWRTYSKALNELVEFGFIKMIEVSKNQHSSNIIAIVKNTKADTKALDKALSKHSTKHSQSIVSIDKQLNNITKKKEQEDDVFSFEDFWNVYPIKKGKAESAKKYNKLKDKDKLIIKNTINDFINDKPFKDYTHPHPLTYINQKRWLDSVDECKKEIPPFNFDFKKHGGDVNLLNKLKEEHERKYS